MKLNPKQAPLYGECVLTVQLSEEECVEAEDDVEFYLLFSGSTQRHLTSTLRVSHVTLQAVCPAHDQDEMVRVTLCQARPGGSVDTVAEERFQYVQDLALEMAHFLIRAAANKDGLEGALLLDDSHISIQECERLDETLTLALKHLPLPTGWSVLGTDVNVNANTDPAPHETLLHFAARRGLRRVTLFLLQQPGGRDALQLLNKHGYTPARLAQRRGHTHLQQLLSELEKSTHLETKPPRRLHPEGRAFVHHPRLNTYTLTGPNDRAGDPPDLQRDVEELRRYIRSHRQDTDSSLKHSESIPLILSPDLVGDLQTVAVTPSVGPSLLKTAVRDHQEAEASELVDVARLSPRPNGSAELQGLDCWVTEAVCEKRAGEGKQEDGVTVGTPSCGEQQQEEVDKDPSTIGAEQQAQDGPETESPHQIQSGNTQDGRMGQTQGLLHKGTVESSENNGRSRDLPEERGGDRLRLDAEQPWEQEDQKQDLNSGYEASGATEEPMTRTEPIHQLNSDREETGNLTAALTETKHHLFTADSSDSAALIPVMTPGPVHDVQLEPSAVVEQSRENVPLDMAPVCPERADGGANEGFPATCAAVSGAELAEDELCQPEALSGTSQQIGDDMSKDVTSMDPKCPPVVPPQLGETPILNTDLQTLETTKIHEKVDSNLIDESEISEMAALLSRMHLSRSFSQDEPPDHQPDSSEDSVHAEEPCSFKVECPSDTKPQSLDDIANDASSEPSFDSNSPEGMSTPSTDPEDIVSEHLPTTEPNPESTTSEEPEDKLLDRGSDGSVAVELCFQPEPIQDASLNQPEVSESEEPVRESAFDQLKISTFEEPIGDPSRDQPEVAMSREPNVDPALDQWLEQKPCGEPVDQLELTSSEGPIGDLSLVQQLEEKPFVVKSLNPIDVTIFGDPNGDPSLDQQLDGKLCVEQSLDEPEVTTSTELIKDPSLDQRLDGKPAGEQFLNPFHVSTFEESIRDPSLNQCLEQKPSGEPSLNLVDITTSEDPNGDPSPDQLLEEKPFGEQTLDEPEVTTSTELIKDPSLDQRLDGKPAGEQFLNPFHVSSFEEPIRDPSLDQCLEQKPSGEPSLNLVDITTSEGPNGDPSLDQQFEEKPSEEQALDHLDTTMSEEPIRAPSLVQWLDGKPSEERSLNSIDVTTFEEPNEDPSLNQRLEGKPCGEQSLEQPEVITSKEPIRDPSLDPVLEEKPSGEQSLNPVDVTTFEEPNRDPDGKPCGEQTLNQPELTTSKEPFGEPSLDQPEVNTSEEPNEDPSLDQQLEEKPYGEQPLNLVVVATSEEPIGDPLLDQRLEHESSGEQSLNPIVTTSEESNEDPSLDQQLEGKPCGEQTLNQPEFTMSKELVGETSQELYPEITNADAVQQTGGTISNIEEPRMITGTLGFEENARIPLEPRTEVSTPVQDAPASVLNTSSDSGLTLENGSTSDPLGVSTQPVDVSSPLDLDSGMSLDVEVDSGTVLDSVCGAVQEEPKEEPRRDDAAAAEAVLAQMEQCEIHRDSEVLYSLDSEQQSSELTCTDVPIEGVCRSVSASSLPDSVSDGDSLLGPDTADDNIFKQSEDSVTLTSGISVSGSLSTDGWSISHPVGEPEEEEKKDRLTEVLQRSIMLRPTARSLSPSRRHSWGPTKNQPGETELGPRSVVKSEEGEKPAGHRRSMSWCPSDVPRPQLEEIKGRSYSLDGLADEEQEEKSSSVRSSTHSSTMEREDRGSLASLTEEEHEPNVGDNSSLDSQRSIQDARSGFVPPHILTKSVSMSAISHKDLDDLGPLTSAVGSLEYSSICEEDPAPLRTDTEVRGTKVSRTFSYLKSKMSKKKEKDRDKSKDGKEKEKRSSNGHLFSSAPIPPTSTCLQCNRPISSKEALTCTNCSVCVHKGCRDGLPVCAKVKMKQQQTVPDSASIPGLSARGKSSSGRERPWSTIALQEDQVVLPVPPPRRNPTLMPFNSNTLSKSISISNIAGQADDAPLKLLKALSQSTDSLNKLSKVNESTESLTDEGAELMDGHLMAEFEVDMKELEADSWSFTVDKKYLKQLKKDVIKRQDVIYELIQTELHHVRTLRIMADVYNKGLQKEVQLESQTLEKMFPVLDELLELHTHFLTHLLERKREAREESQSEGGFVIRRIGDVLLDQVTGSNAERMKKVYGKFCSRHNEAVNVYKELHARDKRFQAFIKRKMSSVVVRRLSIPECILLITQRITKYPVLLQRILQHTREPEEEQADVAEALRQVKEVITGVDSKVNDYEKRRRLKEVYSRTDSKSIMRMTSGQMFAREDLLRGRKLLHDGPLQLKNLAGRLKDVQALLLSDVFVFLQEKDQKYVFASLDQRSTVISLQKLIVREVANEERGLFFITAGIEKPEMVEVHTSSKEERNTWMKLIQSATRSIVKDDDEGIPSENEEDKRIQESKAKEMRDELQKRDEQIVALLEEKVRLFHELCDCANQDEALLRNRMMFRATSDEVTKGEPIIRDALQEVDTLQDLVNSSLVGQQGCAAQDGSSSVCAGSVSLPRRSETFGGFDSHQMNISKNGDREEADDLRRTESDSVLKKGGTANLLLLHKRNSEQILQSVTHLHDLLSTLQAVVVQQDSFIEEQRHTLSSLSHRHPSISSFSSLSSCSSSSSRPSSLMEQEKQRLEEKQREEERRRREDEDRRRKEEEEERRRRKEEELARWEERLLALEEENRRREESLQQEQQELSGRKEEYQRELLKLRDDQRRLERERERHTQRHTQEEAEGRARTSSTTSEDSLKLHSSLEVLEGVEVFSRSDSKRKAKNLNPFTSASGQKGGAVELPSQIPNRLLQLAKTKDKKDKKKKKGKGGSQSLSTELQAAAGAPSETSADKEVYFC